MTDQRIRKLAQVLTHYSLAIKPGDKLWLRGPVAALPLLHAVYEEATRIGAFIFYRIKDDTFDELALCHGTPEQIEFEAEPQRQEVDYADALLSVWSETNTRTFSRFPADRLQARQARLGYTSSRVMTRFGEGTLRWCGTLLPTEAHAQDAGMSLRQYEEFVYGAGLLDRDDPIAAWREVDAQQQRITDLLNTKRQIRIVAPDTDIRYSCAGRSWINCSGRENFPDGEVFTGPIEDSVQGHVRFTFPSVYQGGEAEDVRLRFEDGLVTEATASRGNEYLQAMLNVDAGARRLGEAAFGLNYGITQFTKNILFDEKIGGTMHMALGASYPETGAVNESDLHWDMVCDLREGEVYADDELIYRNGEFII